MEITKIFTESAVFMPRVCCFGAGADVSLLDHAQDGDSWVFIKITVYFPLWATIYSHGGERLRLRPRRKRKGRPQFRLSQQQSGSSLLIRNMEAKGAALMESAGRCMMRYVVQRRGATNVAMRATMWRIVMSSRKPCRREQTFNTTLIRLAIWMPTILFFLLVMCRYWKQLPFRSQTDASGGMRTGRPWVMHFILL